MPESGEAVGGLWAEAALDGVVLFERGLELSLRLVAVRHDIAEGRLVRRFAHGQPYGGGWRKLKNRGLAADYVRRAQVRVKAVQVLFDAGSWADVVRESQKAVELALKGLLCASGIEAPRTHDVSDVLSAERNRLPAAVRDKVERLSEISRALQRDRELAFYGAEDLTPSSFYSREDATRALDSAKWVVRVVRPGSAREASAKGIEIELTRSGAEGALRY